MAPDSPPARARGTTFGQAARTVFWSFFGVRKRAHHEADMGQLNPLHLIVAAIIGAALFIAALLFIIKFGVLA